MAAILGGLLVIGLVISLLAIQFKVANDRIQPYEKPETEPGSESTESIAKTAKQPAKSPKQKAIDWAISMGYPVPTKLDGCLAAILVVVGLLMFVVPGVLLLVWIWVQDNQYERDIKALIEKWVDAGRPEPGEGIKEVTKLERIVETVEPSQGSTEQRLQELESLKEKGLVTDEEYQAMRKKALGL